MTVSLVLISLLVLLVAEVWACGVFFFFCLFDTAGEVIAAGTGTKVILVFRA